MRSIITTIALVLALTCGLFAITKAAPADALAAFQELQTIQPQSCGGCGCPGCPNCSIVRCG
jgi:hypothetical protein